MPPPTFALTVDLQPVSGRVLVQLPSTTARSSAGGRAGFVLLSAPRQVPVGSVIDATAGLVRLTVATPAPAHLQSGSFHGGIFQVLQNSADHGLTVLRIRDNRSRRTTCGLTAAGNPTRRISTTILGLLRGVATGQFRTVGQFAAATVRGTAWGVRDRCDGTLTVVEQGVVDVRDFHVGKNIIVTAGHTYLAQAG